MRARCWQYESHCIAAGVHGLATSASPDTTSVPPITGSTAGSVVAGAAVVAVARLVAGAAPPVVVAGASVAAGADVAAVPAPPLTASSSSLRSEQAAATSAAASSARSEPTAPSANR